MRQELASLDDKTLLLVIIVSIFLVVILFELRVMRSKPKEVRKAAIKKDEAYNAVLTTRAVLNALQRQGRNTGSAAQLLDSGKKAMQRGDYDRCIELCAEARDELIKPRQRTARAPVATEGSVGAKTSLEEVAEGILAPSGEPEIEAEELPEQDSYAGTKLPVDKDGNYLAAKFEVQTAKSDIQRARGSGKNTAEAESMMTEAEGAFVAGDYARALSLAVKAKKSVSAEAAAEAIPLKSKPSPEELKPAPRTKPAGAIRVSAMCGSCGEPLDVDDMFCSKCGARVPKERVCPSCGTKPKTTDAFCRKCGSKVD